jgi:hypothetical protein
LSFCVELSSLICNNTVCPTRYQTRNSFNISNTNEDIATKFEQGYVSCVRNEEECVCSVVYVCNAPNILINGKIIKEMPGSVASGTSCIINTVLSLRNINCPLPDGTKYVMDRLFLS